MSKRKIQILAAVIGSIVVCVAISFPFFESIRLTYQPTATPTTRPTMMPICEPQTGRGYVFSKSIFDVSWSFSGPAFETKPAVRVPEDTPVDILEAKWYSANLWCYFYRVRLPDGNDQVWLPQDYLTVEKGIPVPQECVCRFDQYPDHRPWNDRVYTSVGEDYEIVLSPSEMLTFDKPGNSTLPDGTEVEILESLWTERYGGKDLDCYRYHIRDPKTGVEGWTVEEFLSPDPKQAPSRNCLAPQDRPSFIRIVTP